MSQTHLTRDEKRQLVSEVHIEYKVFFLSYIIMKVSELNGFSALSN